MIDGAGSSLLVMPGGPVGAGTRIDPALLLRLPAANSASAVSADPIADRRRVKALQSLDRRLAEMKDRLRGGVVVQLLRSRRAHRRLKLLRLYSEWGTGRGEMNFK